MKLVSWNVNGIRAVCKKGFLDCVTEWDADVISLQETKAHDEQFPDEVSPLPGYRCVSSAAEKKGYSGVATYVRDGYDLKSVAHGIELPEYDSEGRFIITHIAAPADIVLYNIYFPSGTSGDVRQQYKYEFLDAVLDHLRGLPKATQKKLVITGDFNICHREIDIHHPDVATKRQLSGFLPDERAWMDSFVDAGFIDSFRNVHGDTTDRYSWWSYRGGAREKNKGWRIDYFFTHSALRDRIVHADIHHDTLGSDHCPILLELSEV